jgi:hypothetical protein
MSNIRREHQAEQNEAVIINNLQQVRENLKNFPEEEVFKGIAVSLVMEFDKDARDPAKGVPYAMVKVAEIAARYASLAAKAEPKEGGQ